MAADKIEELRVRAAQLREHSLRATTAAASGHPTTCLSAADLVAALFFDVMRYDPKNPGQTACDRFVLSKGHAAPLLYAAWAEAGAFPVEHLLTLRRIDSELEGHPTPRFEGTVAATGSLGQGLSVGFGVAWNAKRDGVDQRVYVLLGDGEMAEGSVWEAVALAAHDKLDNLVAIVDVNGWGQSQRTMCGHDHDVYAERFASFGWHSIAIDGHDMAQILGAYQEAAATRGRPTAIVARTKKGKGVSFVEDVDFHGKPVKKEDLERAVSEVWSGVGKRSVSSVPSRTLPAAKPAKIEAVEAPVYESSASVATREAYGSVLKKLGKANPLVMVLDGDTKNSTFAEHFAKAFPERYIEGFIAEQNMVGAAVGLSGSGKVPFASSFACFLTRAFDQIRMAAISRANLNLAGSHCGVSIGEDGPSQMGLEDIAMMRAIPDSVVLYPADAVSTERLVAQMARARGIHYLRLTRPKTGILYGKDEEFPIGGSKTLRSNPADVVTVVAAGITLVEALKAYDRLTAQGIQVRIIDAYSVKPLDKAAIVAAGRATKNRILTVEDHYFDGGLGDAVLNAVAGEGIAVSKLAVNGVPQSGKPEELLHRFGIDAAGIEAKVKAIVAA